MREERNGEGVPPKHPLAPQNLIFAGPPNWSAKDGEDNFKNFKAIIPHDFINIIDLSKP